MRLQSGSNCFGGSTQHWRNGVKGSSPCAHAFSDCQRDFGFVLGNQAIRWVLVSEYRLQKLMETIFRLNVEGRREAN